MAAFDYANEQVSLSDDWYYDRSSTVDISNERGNETCYTSGVDHHQDIPCESISEKAEGISSFDAAIEELDLDTNRGSAELQDNVEDEISPAIQISKTFSLATFGTKSQCNEQPSPVQIDKSQQESYKLTNLDNDTEHTDDKITRSSQSDGESHQTYKEERVQEDDSVKSFSSTYKRKRTKKRIGCHVIDLETFSTSRSSSITMEYNDMGSQAPCLSADQDLEHSPVNSSTNVTKGKLSTSIRTNFFGDHSYGIDAMHPNGKQSEPYPLSRQSAYFDDDSKFPCYDVNFSDTNYGNIEMSSFYLPDDCGECPAYAYSLEQMAADSIENEETSDMVIDLNERLPVDSGIFDVSLTRPNTTSSTQGYIRQTNYPYKTKETFTPDGSISGGNFKDRVSFFRDRQITNSPQVCQKKPNPATYEIPYHTTKEASYYDEMMKTLREPFVTDECGYMYQQEHNSSFLCNRIMPCHGWESTPGHKNACTSMIADLVEESGQGMWYSDSFTNLFESREPSDVAQYTYPGNIKDEEETDDADEIGFLPESADISCSYLSHGQDRSNNYLVTESPHMARFTAATLTPPPSESSTPNPPSNHGYNDDMSMYQWAPLSSSCSFSECISNETITTLSPPQHSRFQSSFNHVTPDYLDINLLSYGSQRGIVRPFPSMADAIQSGHPSSPPRYPCNETATRKSDPNTKRRGKSRKIQIQSHKISTSTPKDTKSFGDKSELASPGNSVELHGINKYGKIKPLTRGTKSIESDNKVPRHNEPLRQHAVDVMTRWYEANIHNPYPTKAQKTAMAQEGQISENQVKSWFANKRNRTHNTKPKVQKRAMEQKLKELFKDLKKTNSTTATDNTHIIQQLSGIIQHCHMKVE